MRLKKNDIVTARITAETKTELLNASSKYDLSQSYLISKGIELILTQLKNNK